MTVTNRQRSLAYASALAVVAGLAFAGRTLADERDETTRTEQTTNEKQTKAGAKKASPQLYHSYQGKKPPELTGANEHWVNRFEPVTLAKLHGRVVWLEFNF